MRAIDALTIYIAVGAPFGVSYLLRQHSAAGRLRAFMKAFLALLFWPLPAIASLRTVRRRAHPQKNANFDSRVRETIKDDARQQFLSALNRLEDLTASEQAADCKNWTRSTRAAREGAEKYLALSSMRSNVSSDDEPSERELEIFRIAGRSGDDLQVAGNCIRRRNVAKLAQKHARARIEFLHALAEVGEFPLSGSSSKEANAGAAKRQSLMKLTLLARAVDLLSLHEDAPAAMSVARLLNRECQRLRSLQTLDSFKVSEDLCLTYTSRPSRELSPQTTTLADGWRG